MNTLFLGQQIITLDQIASTNNYTSEFLRQNVMQEGAIVLANHQNEGKGQRGNLWHSNPNENLTFSIYIKPVFIPTSMQFVLNKWVSLSIVYCLRKEGIGASVKWPNDIYVEDKKIGGVLIENSVSSGINHSIIGIGLNVNQKEFNNLPKAASIISITGKAFDLESLLEKMCVSLEQNYLRIKVNLSALDEEYLSAMYQYEKFAMYRDESGSFSGKITGVSAIGQLEIETNEEVRSSYFKEVEFL